MERVYWISVMGYPEVVIDAQIVYGDGPEDGHVLVDGETRNRMAHTLLDAMLLDADDDAERAIAILSAPRAPEPYARLFDVTEAGGGWKIWSDGWKDFAQSRV